jgi:hypothetical protein
MPFEVSPEITEAIKQHALDAFPHESCGFITADGYIRVENISDDPANSFRLEPAAFLIHKDALAFVHSHPVEDAFDAVRYKPGFYPFCPSGADMRSQIATGMTFGIVVTDGKDCFDPFYWGDFILDEPIYDRPFRHGVEDCYSICRKWFWQEMGVKLPDFARDPDWWNGDEDLYLANFPAAGFEKLGSSEELKVGDVGLVQLGASSVKTINHAFINLGDGTICHHLPHRLSSREAAGGRRREQKLWVRYVGKEEPVQGSPAEDEA